MTNDAYTRDQAETFQSFPQGDTNGREILGYGCFPIFLATIPAETVGVAHAGRAIGLVIGVGEVAGGFFAPMIEGYASDRFGAQAPFLIASAATFVAMLFSFALKETAPIKAHRAGSASAIVHDSVGA